MLDKISHLISDLIAGHWAKVLVAVAFMVAGWWLGKWRARAQWRKKEFLNRLNVSLNVLRDGKLLIRTVSDKSLEEIFLNAVAVEKVIAAAQRTTEANPLLPLTGDDAWYLLNSVLNEVAEMFSEGQLRRDLGLPVTIGRYLLCLTRERAGDMRTHKIRAMLVQKSLLQSLPEEPPQFESPHHLTRFHTLHRLAKSYQQDPKQFIEIEICL